MNTVANNGIPAVPATDSLAAFLATPSMAQATSFLDLCTAQCGTLPACPLSCANGTPEMTLNDDTPEIASRNGWAKLTGKTLPNEKPATRSALLNPSLAQLGPMLLGPSVPLVPPQPLNSMAIDSPTSWLGASQSTTENTTTSMETLLPSQAVANFAVPRTLPNEFVAMTTPESSPKVNSISGSELLSHAPLSLTPQEPSDRILLDERTVEVQETPTTQDDGGIIENDDALRVPEVGVADSVRPANATAPIATDPAEFATQIANATVPPAKHTPPSNLNAASSNSSSAQNLQCQSEADKNFPATTDSDAAITVFTSPILETPTNSPVSVRKTGSEKETQITMPRSYMHTEVPSRHSAPSPIRIAPFEAADKYAPDPQPDPSVMTSEMRYLHVLSSQLSNPDANPFSSSTWTPPTSSAGSDVISDPAPAQSSSGNKHSDPGSSASNSGVSVSNNQNPPTLAAPTSSAQSANDTAPTPNMPLVTGNPEPSGNARNVDPNRSSSDRQRPTPATAPPSSAGAGTVQMAQLVNRTTQSEMRIGLTTTAFGNVEVRTSVHANDVGIQIGSEKGDLRSMLANEIPGIAHHLQQQNLRLNQVDFHQGFGASHSMSSGGESHPRPFQSKPAPMAAPTLGANQNHETTEHFESCEDISRISILA